MKTQIQSSAMILLTPIKYNQKNQNSTKNYDNIYWKYQDSQQHGAKL